jgi:prolyl-tRNA editing enzyme YbaK/EbsC (Cys-tRNA(Pro) deacylase)
MNDSPVFNRIVQWLRDEQVPFRHMHHEPTPTSEDAAKARGEPLHIGGKAIVLKADDTFISCILSASLRLDAKALRRALGVKKIRFATPQELLELTGLVPGSVPPFGEPILPLPLYVDQSVADQPRIAFNAGALTDSIIMATDDYLRLAGARVLAFSAPAKEA